MSKINSMMDLGKRSMMNSQTALQTVGHNIANKNTEGYSRQRVELNSSEPITSSGGLRIGQGSKATAVTRINNPYLEKQIGKEQASMGFYKGKADALLRVEQVYNEQINRGLNNFLSDFFNAFRELANNPESTATRTMVRETADFACRDFKRVDTQLKEIRMDIDQQIANNIESINQITEEVARLNEKIQGVELGRNGAVANDERDRRDVLIKQLGEKINIRWSESADGSVTVTAGNSALLVAGFESKKLVPVATQERGGKGEGNFDIMYFSTDQATPINITDQIKGGALGGLVETRDVMITDLLKKLDDMAYTLAEHVNSIHREGIDSYNGSGNNFFDPLIESHGAASRIQISDKILNDARHIAAGEALYGPADNRVANRISNLQYEHLIDNGRTTLDDFYNSMVGEVGIITRRAQQSFESQSEVLRQLSNIRESVSGVSLDEEATKMIEYQKSFDASARLIRTADEMFDTVLNLKKL